MTKPINSVFCWILNDEQLQNCFYQNRPFNPPNAVPFAYFNVVDRPNDNTIIGNLGHENLNGQFHNQIISSFTYLDDYNNCRPVYITFDKVSFYQVAEIFPDRPLQFTLKKLTHPAQDNFSYSANKQTHPLHFEDLGWEEFERLVFAYLSHTGGWDTIQWLGQTGGDGGRDIWGMKESTIYCYQCANYKSLPFKKVTSDINKLVKENIIPHNFIVVCGGRVSANMRIAIHSHALQYGINNVEVWSGAELEEKLRKNTPELLARFF